MDGQEGRYNEETWPWEGRQQSDSQTKNTARWGAGGQETEHDVQDKTTTADMLDARRREIESGEAVSKGL